MAKSSSKKPSRSSPPKSKKVVAAKGKKPVKPLAKKATRPSNRKDVIKKPLKKAKPSPGKKLAAKPAVKAPVALAKPKSKSKPPVVVKAAAKPAISPVKPVAKSKSLRPSSAVLVKPEPFQMQITPAVATNLKPRKNQIGLGVKELEHFRDLLLAKRRELVGDMSSMEREALRSGRRQQSLQSADPHGRHGHRQLRAGIHPGPGGKRPQPASRNQPGSGQRSRTAPTASAKEPATPSASLASKPSPGHDFPSSTPVRKKRTAWAFEPSERASKSLGFRRFVGLCRVLSSFWPRIKFSSSLQRSPGTPHHTLQ